MNNVFFIIMNPFSILVGIEDFVVQPAQSHCVS